MIFSSKALKLTSTSICESPVRRSIIVSHAGGLIPLCQIFHFRASSAIRKTILQRWLDAIWTPVGSKLYCDPHYRKEFMEPTNNAAFVYFLVRGGACPRDGRKKKTTAHGSSGNNFCHNVCLVPLTPVLELNDCAPLRYILSFPRLLFFSFHPFPPDKIYMPYFPPAALRPQI
jgi:hypothetical protein